MNHPIRSVALVLSVSALLYAAEAGHEGHDHEPAAEVVPSVTLAPEAMERHGVVVGAAETSKALGRPVNAPAWVAYDPDRMAHVGAVVSGRVAKLRVGVGAVVKAGDPLVEIDSSELGRAQSEYFQKRAGLAVARAGISAAEQAHQRAVALVAEQAMPAAEAQRREFEFARAKTEVMAAEADLQAAENALLLLGMDDEARAELERSGKIAPRLIVRAPIDGTVIERPAAIGQVVGPDTERMLTIADPAALWVLANVPEAQAREIVVGSPASISGPLLGDRAIETTVTFVSPSVDAQTRSVQVRLAVAEGAGLRPGAFVQVVITPTSKRSSVVVPRGAVFTVDSMATVFVPDGAPNRFIARSVDVGPAIGDQVPILAGLKSGDSLIVKGGFLIKADLGKAGAKGCCDSH